jgi:predicted lipoprotein with Yx(FWY)xxD motif
VFIPATGQQFPPDGRRARQVTPNPALEMNMKYVTLLLAGLLAANAAVAQNVPTKTVEGALVGPNGMTLYIFDKDAKGSGKSVCNGQCATNWPPLMAEGALSGDYSTVTRDDGKAQVAYKGMPLYYWIKDTKAGDKTGDNVNNVWHVAKP